MGFAFNPLMLWLTESNAIRPMSTIRLLSEFCEVWLLLVFADCWVLNKAFWNGENWYALLLDRAKGELKSVPIVKYLSNLIWGAHGYTQISNMRGSHGKMANIIKTFLLSELL